MSDEKLQHMGAEAADGAFLDGDQHLVIAGEPQDQLLVEGLGEAGIGDGGREAARFQLLGRLQGFRKAGAERQDRDAAALLDDAALADGERHALFGHVHAHPFAARIAEGDGAGIVGGGGRHHMDELRLVGWPP